MLSYLEKALDALAVQQRVLASNVANANTPTYRRQEVDFFTHMQRVFAGENPTLSIDVDPGSAGRPDRNNVNLEREMVTLAENHALYATAARLATGALQRMKMAVTEGQG